MKILAIQNRMGIGDTVLFLPFIKAISQKFNSPVSILVKENSKAEQYLYNANYIDNIIVLDRTKNPHSRHNGILGGIKLIYDLKKYKFDKIFIFNSSLRYNLVAKFSGIKEIYQYPLFKKRKQHIVDMPRKFIKDKLDLDIRENPEIKINKKLVKETIVKYKIDKDVNNILLGIGGSGPTKRIPSSTFLNVIEKALSRKKCKFFLATGNKRDEQIILNEIIHSNFGKNCVRLDHLSIKETLPIIKCCNVSICNDSSFSHLSAALNIKTITLMADTPLIYGSYNTNMIPIIPDDVESVTHGTLGKDKINPKKIFDKLEKILF